MRAITTVAAAILALASGGPAAPGTAGGTELTAAPGAAGGTEFAATVEAAGGTESAAARELAGETETAQARRPETSASSYPRGHLGLAADPVALATQVPEPLFAFLLRLADGDSLGRWSRDDVTGLAAAMGKPSKLPLDRLIGIERRVAVSAEREERRGARVERVWRILFAEPIVEPIPYSILGYHPGRFMLARELILSEWPLGDLGVQVRSEDGARDHVVAGLTVLRVDRGHIVMDIDGWLDRLLGELLDDAWMDGIAAARVDGDLVGIGISVGRRGQRIFGEFDFAADEVLAHGRPAARAISRHSRRWIRPPANSNRRPWVGLGD